MTRIRPARPFPPHGCEDGQALDLGIRLRDAIFRRAHVERVVRPALAKRLEATVEQQRWMDAAVLVEAFVDTWPAASLVDEARTAWTAGPDPRALAILFRVALLGSIATGSSEVWPTVGPVLARKLIGNRLVSAVEHRHPEDNAHALAGWLDAPVVRVDPPEPRAPAAHEAPTLATLLGPMAAGLGPLPTWESLLHGAPGCELPERPSAHARIVELPGTLSGLRSGTPELTPWLVWDGPYRPLPVTGPAAAVLSAMDGERNIEELAEALSAPVGAVLSVAEGLARIGAAC